MLARVRKILNILAPCTITDSEYRQQVVRNNIRLRAAKIVKDKADFLNHTRFKRARDNYVWNGVVQQTDRSRLDLERVARELARANTAKIELWSLSYYRYNTTLGQLDICRTFDKWSNG